jgi:glucose-1-phosphate adenylyltransferase
MGIYVFNRKFLVDLLEKEKKESTDFGKEIIPDALQQYNVASYQYDGYWTDIGNIHSFFEANLGLTKDIPDFNLFDNTNAIYTRARMLPPAKISGTMINKTIIAEGCIINASHIENSVVGIRSRIGHGTTVVSSYLMGNDYFETISEIEHDHQQGFPNLGIGNSCYIKNAIVDKNVRIGDNVRIDIGPHLENTDQPLYTIKDGIIVIKKGAVIPDNFKL